MADSNTWKLQDAKAQFSEVVRRARSGEPQHVTVHGKKAVVIADAERFEVRPKPAAKQTMADFVEGSKKYRLDHDVEFELTPATLVTTRPSPFDEDGS
jgi:prevent-host-death family protein